MRSVPTKEYKEAQRMRNHRRTAIIDKIACKPLVIGIDIGNRPDMTVKTIYKNGAIVATCETNGIT